MASLLEQLKLQLQILQLKLQVLLLRQKLTIPNLGTPTKIILHHGGGWLDFKGVDFWHKQKWGYKSSLGYYVGYTYFIETNGKTYQARQDNEKGAHTKGFNERTIGIGLMGNGEEFDFTPEQYKSLKELVDRKMAEYNLTRQDLYGHHNFSNTLCPSWRLKNWINSYTFG